MTKVYSEQPISQNKLSSNDLLNYFTVFKLSFLYSNIDLNDQPASGTSSHRSTPNGEKVTSKVVREVSIEINFVKFEIFSIVTL